MTNNDKEDLTDHDYDGIQEYDNPLPAWWLYGFFLTIIFGFHYWLHYSIGGGATQFDELKEDMAQIEQLKQKSGSQGGAGESEDALVALGAQPETLTKGQAVFEAKCAVCHGPQLQGLIGPNLTDDYWLHGRGHLIDIISTVRKGVLEKGMPAWEEQLPKTDIQAVVVFVHSKRGSNPPNPKAPQGEKIAD